MPDRFTPPPLVRETAEGSETWDTAQGTIDLSTAGHYTGPEAQAQPPWKCPACRVENVGRLEDGCVHCGSGKPGYHVGVAPPAQRMAEPDVEPVPVHMTRVPFEVWLSARCAEDLNPAGIRKLSPLLYEAYLAGWIAGAQRQQRRATSPAPLPSAVGDLPPEGKPTRTIIAALELFRDQVLAQDPEEIGLGEWCSPDEVTALIRQLQETL